MFCVKCGNQLSDEAVFCNKCGKKVEKQIRAKFGEKQFVEQKATKSKKKKWLLWCIPVVVIAALVVCYFAFNLCFFHEWTDATCTASKTCIKCEKTEGEALGHTWMDATCIVPKTCQVCGETEGKLVDHIWQEATCTMSKTCLICGKKEGASLKHIWIEATCMAPKYCSLCNVKIGSTVNHNLDQNGRCMWCDSLVGIEIKMSNYEEFYKVETEWIGTDKEKGGYVYMDENGYPYIGLKVTVTPAKQGNYEFGKLIYDIYVSDRETRKCFDTNETTHTIEIDNNGYGSGEIIVTADRVNLWPEAKYIYPVVRVKLKYAKGLYKN